MDSRTSLFERLVSNPRHPRVTLGGALVLLLIPLIDAFAEGSLGEVLTTPSWRGLLVAPTIILYILFVAPRLERTGRNVMATLRPAVLVDDSTYEQLIVNASSVSLRNELLAFGSGIGLGIVLIDWRSEGPIHWLSIYWFVTSCLMYGLLSWTIYVALVTSRAIGVLLRQPLRVDPLDITPFEAVGRLSLLIALVFVGGIALGMLVSVPVVEVLFEPGFWLVNIPIILAPIVIFFLSMQPTHKVLAAAKARELRIVDDHLKRASASFLQYLANGHDTGLVAQEISALSVIEQRLQGAQTWPYNMAMLRTLFVSVLVPFFTMVGKFVLDQLIA